MTDLLINGREKGSNTNTACDQPFDIEGRGSCCTLSDNFPEYFFSATG